MAVGRDFCHLVLVAPVLLVGTAREQRGSAKGLKAGQMGSNEMEQKQKRRR